MNKIKWTRVLKSAACPLCHDSRTAWVKLAKEWAACSSRKHMALDLGINWNLGSTIHWLCELGPCARPLGASVSPSAKWVNFYFPGLLCRWESMCMKYLALCMVQRRSSVIDTCYFSESDYGECDWMDTYDSPTVGKSLCLVLLKQCNWCW